jgi:hypothetical protein
MNEEQQRIAIAEACGFKARTDRHKPMWVTPDGKTLLTMPEHLPDYLNDLNAMHEAETLVIYSNDKSPKKYTQQIKAAICKDAGVKKAQMDFDMCITATAAQRAEAFLRTIGKWTTNQNEL